MGQQMRMINIIESGMKAEAQRQKALANNLANMNTPGFRRYDVKFEDLLSDAMDKEKYSEAEKLRGELFKPKNTPLNENRNDVQLDHEVGEMVKNTLKHKAYMLLLKKKYMQFDLAMKVT